MLRPEQFRNTRTRIVDPAGIVARIYPPVQKTMGFAHGALPMDEYAKHC